MISLGIIATALSLPWEEFPLTKSSDAAKRSLTSSTNLILLGITWGIVSLMFFLLFSVPPPGEEQPDWYFIGITIAETGAFLLSALLCFRNWQSGQIVSGRNVWLWIGTGLLSYALGNLLFYLWGNVWGQDPAVSLGDIFYLLSYVFLGGGMLQAVLPRRLNLELKQWGVVLIIGFLGVFLAYFLNYGFGGGSLDELVPLDELQGDGVEEVAPVTIPENAPEANGEGAATDEAVTEEATTESTTTTEGTATEDAVAADAEEEAETNAPSWVLAFDQGIEPFEGLISLLYVVGDCFLVVIAATLLVAFWGGRFSQSWKLIAIAAICLYVADMFFAYYVQQATYQEGSLWEVFWTFSALFFGMGAVVEYAISTQSRRSSRRRRSGGA